jgi:hypothetical protein
MANATLRYQELRRKKNSFHQLPVTCLLPVTCYLSPVTCHLSPVTCHLFPTSTTQLTKMLDVDCAAKQKHDGKQRLDKLVTVEN